MHGSRSRASASRRLVGGLMAGVLLCAGAGTGPAAAAPAEVARWATPQQLDEYLTRERAALRFPGLAVVVVAGGEVLFEGAYGEATPGVPVTLDTPFRLGSTSKQFTGLAVQRLIAQGRLTLDTKVASVLPAFAEAGPLADTTVRQLLAHRSGLSEQDGHEQWSPWPPGATVQEEADRLSRVPLTHAPGAVFEYTNAGYTILGAMVERVTGQPFEMALQSLVARPLGLRSTTSDDVRARAQGLAGEYYSWFGQVNVLTPASGGAAAAPSAYVTSTARDLTGLLKAHLGAAVPADAGVLAAARQPLGVVHDHADYASGWNVRGLWELTDLDEGWESPDRPTLWDHEGSIGRALSYLAFAPDLGLGVVALANTGAGTDQMRWSEFRYRLLHHILGTVPLTWAKDPLILAAPALMLGLPLLQVATLGWALRRRRRAPALGWAPLIVAGVPAAAALVFALIVVPGQTRRPLLDAVWMTSVPDLAASVGLSFLAVTAYAIAVLRWVLARPTRSLD